MVLESTMICADNSDFMRNGDFLPTRMVAQMEAINILCLSKTRSNPENNVGLLTLANVEVLVTLTADSGKILAKLHRLQPNGVINLLTSIRIAHLALKHRQGKNHKMRIVVFIGSPVGDLDVKEMEKLAKKLKKEKVNVDIIHFGEEATYSEVLHTFVNTLNGADGTGSHLLTVKSGPVLTDALVSSAIIQGEDGVAAGGMVGGVFEFGVDPNEDPELALALRVSMEEQRQRVETEPAVPVQQAASEARMVPEVSSSSAVPMEDNMLEQALAMSMEQDVQNQAGSSSTATLPNVNFATMTEEEQIAYAMQMSMQDAQVTPKTDQRPIEKMDVDDSDTTEMTQNPDKSDKEEMNVNPVSSSATPPPEFSRMVYGRLEPDVQPSTVQNEEPPVGLSRMIPGESSSPEPQVMAFNDQVDLIQNSLSQVRITPATYVPTNFADWPDIEPEPVIEPIPIHSSRSMNDMLPISTNPLHIPENERETDVEGANIQDPIPLATNQRDNPQCFKQSINHRNDGTNRRQSRRNPERENMAIEADISNCTDNESNHSESNTSDSAVVPTTTSRKYRNGFSNNEKDHRKSKHNRSHTYYESGKLKSERSYDYGGSSGNGSRHYRSRQSSISDMYTEGYTSDYHRGYGRKYDKHENDPQEKRHRRKRAVEKDYYNAMPHNYYYGNMSHDMAMFNPFLSNYYQQYTIQYQNWLMHQQKLAKAGVMNAMKPSLDPYYSGVNSKVHSSRSSVSEFEKHDLMSPQPNVLTNIDENDHSEMYSFTKQTYHNYEQRTTPLKFTIKHSRANFAIGNLIVCNSANSYDNRLCSPFVNVINVKDILENDPFRAELEDFPGPLVKGVVHKSTVIEYCEDKIRSAHFRTDLGDVDSYVLIWEFLVLIIRQNGIMEGADISDLLMRNECFDTLKSRSSKDSKSDKSDKQKRPLTKEESVDRYRDLLIKGDLNKALDWAMSNDLWGHALYLASRIDKRTYLIALSKFESSLAANDPIQTFYQFMSQKRPSFITSFIDDKRNEWRKHLAIMISNIAQEADIVRDSIISLGDTLMTRNNLFAAQFCYLIASADFGTYGQDGVKLVLLGSSHNIPFNEFATNEAVFMTEIYEYVRQLHSHPLKLPHFLPYKFILATRLLEYGLTEKAMLYLEYIAKEIYTNDDPVSTDFGLAKNVSRLASRLQYQMAVIAESDDLNWIQKLDNFIDSNQIRQNNQPNIVETERLEPNDKPDTTYVPQTTILHNSDQYESQNTLKVNFQPEPIFQQERQLQQTHFQPYSQPLQFQSHLQQPEQQHVAPIPEVLNETPFPNFVSGAKPRITLPNQNINFDDKPKQDYFDEQKLSDKSEPKQVKPNEKNSEKMQSSSNPVSSSSKFWPFSIMNKILPKPRNQMILPDDSKPAIVYNKDTNTWVDVSNNNENGNNNAPLQPPPRPASLSNLSNCNIPNNINSVRSEQNILANFNNNLPPNPFMNPNNMFKSQNTRGPRKAYLDVLNSQQQTSLPNSTNNTNNPVSPNNFFNKITAVDPVSPINGETMKVFTPETNSHSTFLGH